MVCSFMELERRGPIPPPPPPFEPSSSLFLSSEFRLQYFDPMRLNFLSLLSSSEVSLDEQLVERRLRDNKRGWVSYRRAISGETTACLGRITRTDEYVVAVSSLVKLGLRENVTLPKPMEADRFPRLKWGPFWETVLTER